MLGGALAWLEERKWKTENIMNEAGKDRAEGRQGDWEGGSFYHNRKYLLLEGLIPVCREEAGH